MARLKLPPVYAPAFVYNERPKAAGGFTVPEHGESNRNLKELLAGDPDLLLCAVSVSLWRLRPESVQKLAELIIGETEATS